MPRNAPLRKVSIVTRTLPLSPAPVGAAPVGEPDRKQQTTQLLQSARCCAGAERRRFEDDVIRLNIPVARDVARRYRGRDVALDDLEQVALLGLVKAVRRYRPDRGGDFLSFAVPTIRGELRRHFRDHGWAVRPSRPVQELQAAIPPAEEALCQELGRRPTVGELAERLDVDVDAVVAARAAQGCFVPASLDTPVHPESSTSVGETLTLEDPGFEHAEVRAMLRPLLRRLSARERRIIFLRYVRGWTQAEIGADIGVTQMQVSRLTTAILGQLRQQLRSAA